MFNTMHSIISQFGALKRTADELDLLKSHMDVPNQLFEEFQAARESAAYREAYELREPLVSVCVATFNRAPLLIKRCVESIRRQDYENLEIIVVGDHCTDNTFDLLARIEDPRLRCVNLPQRGAYPAQPQWRWLVAGSVPCNHAIDMAKGCFITHLDDDDEYVPDRIRKLVRLIQETRADVVWHPFWYEDWRGKWKVNNAKKFTFGSVTTSSVLYHRWFRRVPADTRSYRLREPEDWGRFRKFIYLGANLERHPEPLLRHYKEKNQGQHAVGAA